MSAPAVSPTVLPAPLAIVPADQVAAAIAAAHAELQWLDAEQARLAAEADELEGAVGDDPFDPGSHEFVAVRFQRFLDGLRAEANGELDALLATAGMPRSPAPVLSWAPLLAERAAGIRPAPPAAVAPPAPVVPVAPHPELFAEMPDPGSPPPVPPAAPATPVPLGLPRVPVAVPADPEAAPVVDLAPPTGERALEAEFWSDEPSPGWGHARRTLRTVGWQAAAVLLVVAAVLVRVG